MSIETPKRKHHIAKRIFAGAIDYTLIVSCSMYYSSISGEESNENSLIITSLFIQVPILIWFVFTVGFEQIFNATIGNLSMGLKPISTRNTNTFSSQKPTFKQSFLRHLCDPIDMAGFGLMGALSIQFSKKYQRIGDLLGGTIVVSTQEARTNF